MLMEHCLRETEHLYRTLQSFYRTLYSDEAKSTQKPVWTMIFLTIAARYNLEIA